MPIAVDIFQYNISCLELQFRIAKAQGSVRLAGTTPLCGKNLPIKVYCTIFIEENQHIVCVSLNKCDDAQVCVSLFFCKRNKP